MKTISITDARRHIKDLLDQVKETGEVFAIDRRNNLEALLLKFPSKYNSKLNDITNINTHSASFDFLNKEPDLYSLDDLKEKYD
jgi:antitoxin (DNA-binding transcriptional repressor) of toxin-antitoxin stability system